MRLRLASFVLLVGSCLASFASAGPRLVEVRMGGKRRTLALEKEISGGYFSSAHLARDTKTGEPAFVKLFRPERAKKGVKDTYDLETSILSRLHGPNANVFPKALGVGQTKEANPSRAMAMEPLGVTPILHRRQAPGRAARIVGRVCDGLAVLHADGYVHRDLRERNILVDADARSASTRLVDLGAAVRIDEHNTTQVDIAGAAELLLGLVSGTRPDGASEVVWIPDALKKARSMRAPGTKQSMGDVISAAFDGKYGSIEELSHALGPWKKL